jgi:hypothetical protein
LPIESNINLTDIYYYLIYQYTSKLAISKNEHQYSSVASSHVGDKSLVMALIFELIAPVEAQTVSLRFDPLPKIAMTGAPLWIITRQHPLLATAFEHISIPQNILVCVHHAGVGLPPRLLQN